MCGFTGIYNFREHSPVDQQLAGQMTRSLAHRGPDDEGSHYLPGDGLFLGHRRLSIIDLSTGHQPMSNEDGRVWIVFNGEIYNFRELRGDLKKRGHIFKSQSDTESILHAYEEYGIEAFSRLNGMFALALWDGYRRKLILARDPLGIKPLYYWQNQKSLAFASEIKSLLHHPEIHRDIDELALASFFSLTYVPSPRTVFRNILKLAPGHLLVCDREGIQTLRFDNHTPRPDSSVPEREIVEELGSRIEAAVKRQMIADVPVGAMLSGGIDSSALVTIMSQTGQSPVKTFTVGFEGNFKCNELAYAREVARGISSDHHEVIISAQDYHDFLPRSLWFLEEPISTGSTLAFYMVCKLAREHVKVVLTGQGADEPFAGYPRHWGEHIGSLYRKIPGIVQNYLIRPVINHFPRNERLKRAAKSLGLSDPILRFAAVYDILTEDLHKNLFREDVLPDPKDFIQDIISQWLPDVQHLDGLNQMTYLDSRLSLADNLLLYSDKMSMAVSLEARVPFLDLELLRYVESIPSRYKIKGFTQKYILKKTAHRWIPRRVINRRKIGFTTPLDDWFQKELAFHIKDRLLASGSGCRKYFKEELLLKMIGDHIGRREDFKRILFSLLTFELWHDQFIRPPKWEAR